MSAMDARPTLLSSCAAAATAREAAFRIDARERKPRSTRVVALDAAAGRIVDRLAHETWQGARFLTFVPGGTDAGGTPDGEALADVALDDGQGSRTRLSDELAEADFVMMVATEDAGAPAAAAIGNACTLRGIMTAGLVVGSGGGADAAVTALRPHARVLIVSDDQQDADAVLTAVGS
jgi:hypothetical protein